MDLNFTLSPETYRQRINQDTGTLEAILQSKVDEFTTRLYDLIEGKLSGEVLEERTGQLAGSVMQQAAAWVGAVCGAAVGIPDDSPAFAYGIVHELGGQGFYSIFPKEKLALMFEVGEGGDAAPWGGQFAAGGGGMFVLAGHVNHPPAEKRPFIASSVEELREPFFAEMYQVISDVLGG